MNDDTYKNNLNIAARNVEHWIEATLVELILYPCIPRWDGTTEVKGGKINHESLSDLLSVETLICRAVGGKEIL